MISISPAIATESLQKFNIDLQEMISSYEPIRIAISNYVSTFELRGEAYSKHKAYKQNGHVTLLAKKIDLLQQIIELNNQHISLIATHLTGLAHFDQFHILENILTLRFLINIAPDGLNTFALERQLRLWKNRERQLETYVFLTNNLYDGVEGALASVDIQLARLEFATFNPTTGRFYLPSIADIKTKRAELELIKKARELIIAISEKGIPFPDDWSEQDKLDFARRYIIEMKLLDTYMNNTFVTTDFRENYYEARAAQIAYIFLSGIELAFHLTFEQRIELLEVVRNANGWIDPVEEALLGMELNITNENRIKLGDAIPGMPFVRNVPTRIGDVRWFAYVAIQTYAAATMGTTFHDRLTFIAAISFVEWAGKMGSNYSHVRELYRGTGGNTVPSRPTWRQSELDVQRQFPNHQPQQSFLNGKRVPYGTRGSVRPDLFKPGQSIEVKNYNVQTVAGRNNLVNNISNQVNQRTTHLPSGTNQKVIIDVRGQNVTNAQLKEIRNSILENSNVNVEIVFKR